MPRYGIAAGCAVVALLARLALDPILAGALPFVTLFAGVAAAVWYGGVGPAVLATVLGGAGAVVLFIEPQRRVAEWTQAELVGLLGYLVAAAVIILFGALLRRARALAERPAAEALGEREWLRTTLASIGDAVIATDVAGRVTFLNGVAERLTGWSAAEARGLSLERAFQVVDEATHRPVPNPAASALAEGPVVGLTDHSVLVAKDGTEFPVDDSAAPIRGAGGDIVGVVLVFRDVTERRRADQALRESEGRKAGYLQGALEPPRRPPSPGASRARPPGTHARAPLLSRGPDHRRRCSGRADRPSAARSSPLHNDWKIAGGAPASVASVFGGATCALPRSPPCTRVCLPSSTAEPSGSSPI